MKLLRDIDPPGLPKRIATLWTQPDTFAFLPAQSTVDEEWVTTALANLPPRMQVNHFALLTTGSTGHPKLVVGEKARSEKLAALLHELQEAEDVLGTIVVLPLSYSYAFVNQWLWSHVTGRRLTVTKGGASPEELAAHLTEADRAMLCLVGSLVPLFVRHFGDCTFPGVIRLNFAGDRFPQERLPEIEAMFPNAKIFNNYGCAEAMPRLALRSARASEKPAAIGKPLPGVELSVREDGELLFRSPYGAVATIGQNGARLINPDDWVETGDLGYVDKQGDWHLLGREKDVFKRYGEKVSVAELLSTVNKYWRGNASFFREQDPAGEQGVVLVLAPRPDDSEIKSILRGFRAAHRRAHWPLRIESLPTIPTLPNGKIDTPGLVNYPNKVICWRQRL